MATIDTTCIRIQVTPQGCSTPVYFTGRLIASGIIGTPGHLLFETETGAQFHEDYLGVNVKRLQDEYDE